jgi:nitrogen regulatory protein P-II 1
LKLVTAVLPVAGFEQVHEALRTLGIPGVTVSTVFAKGVQPPRYEVYRGVRRLVELRPAVRMDLVVADSDAADVVRVVLVAGAGHGGSVWVQPVEQVVRIRTRERGEAAL